MSSLLLKKSTLKFGFYFIFYSNVNFLKSKIYEIQIEFILKNDIKMSQKCVFLKRVFQRKFFTFSDIKMVKIFSFAYPIALQRKSRIEMKIILSLSNKHETCNKPWIKHWNQNFKFLSAKVVSSSLSNPQPPNLRSKADNCLLH